MKKFTLLILVLLFSLLIFQIYYTPKLNLTQSEVEKLKIGMTLHDAVNLFAEKQTFIVELNGYNCNGESKKDSVFIFNSNNAISLISKYYLDSISCNENHSREVLLYKKGVFKLVAENRKFSLINGTYLGIVLNKSLKVIAIDYMEIQPDEWRTLYTIEDSSYYSIIN
jgi:hypothetical protein